MWGSCRVRRCEVLFEVANRGGDPRDSWDTYSIDVDAAADLIGTARNETAPSVPLHFFTPNTTPSCKLAGSSHDVPLPIFN